MTFSEADYRMVALSLRHERAGRVWKARKRGHRPRGLDQLHRLERIFCSLADRRRAAG